MKVLYISRRFYPDVTGGGQISAYHMARAVKALGPEVHVLTFTTSGYKEEELDGIKVYRYPIFYVNIPLVSHFLNSEGMYLQMAYRSWKVLDGVKPDVVHLLNMESVYITSWILKKKKIPSFETVNAPWVCGLGNCIDYRERECTRCSTSKMFRCFMRKGSPTLTGRLWRFLKFIHKYLNMKEMKFFEDKVDRLLPISNGLKELFAQNGYDEKRMRVIPLIIPEQKKVETNLKERLGVKEDEKVILYIGRVAREKGVHRAIEAMRYISNAVLLIVGKGSYAKTRTEYYRSLEKQVEDYGLGDKVRFVGYVEPREVREYYSIADLTVLPCWWFEGFSRTLLESCAYGIPAIATKVGGIPDVIEDGKNGILLKTLETEELVKAIEYVLQNPDVYRKMSEYCKEKVEREFSPEKVGRDLLKEYEMYAK